MKIKIFRGDNTDKVEAAVNEFIESVAVVDIKYSTDVVVMQFTPSGVPQKSSFFDSVMITYEEN